MAVGRELDYVATQWVLFEHIKFEETYKTTFGTCVLDNVLSL